MVDNNTVSVAVAVVYLKKSTYNYLEIRNTVTPINRTTFGPWQISRVDEVRSHYDATPVKHALDMNTFNSATNQPFHNYYSTLQQQFTAEYS